MKKLTESNLKLRDWIIGYDYFISYSHKDGVDYPLALKRALEQEGYRVCLDQEDFFAGQDLAFLTKRRIRSSKNLIVIGREYALTLSKWVPEEVTCFLEDIDSAASAGPITIDVNGTLEQVLQQAEHSNALAQRLSAQDWLRIEETLADSVNTPSAHVLGELKRAYRGVRAESKQLRIQTAVSLFLLLLVVGLGYSTWSATQAATRAEAERIGSSAVTAATASDPQIGFTGSAFADAARALALSATEGTATSASRVIQLSPYGLRYAPTPMMALDDLAVENDIIYVAEGSAKLHLLNRDDLSANEILTPASLGLDFIGSLVSTDEGVVVLGRLRGVWRSPGNDQPFQIPGFARDTAYDPILQSILYSTHDSGVHRIKHGDTESTICTPMDGRALFTFAALGDGTVVMLTQESRTIHLLHVNIGTCSLIRRAKIENTSAYRLLANPKSETLVVHTSEQLVVLDKQLKIIQNLPDAGMTLWHPVMVSNNRQQRVEGFVTGQGNGTVRLYTVSKSGHANLTETSNSILPGQIQKMVWHDESQSLIMSGRKGHFVASDLPGVLAKLPLTIQSFNGVDRIHFAQADPAESLASFPGFSRILYTAQSRSQVFYGLTDGSIYKVDAKGHPVLISESDDINGRATYSLRGLSATGNDLYSVRRISDSQYAVIQENNGQEVPVLEIDRSIAQLAATPEGFFYRTDRDIFHYEVNRSRTTPITVDRHNGNQGHQTMVVSPDGNWVVFGLFDGFEIRPMSKLSDQGACRADPQNGQAGVIATFSKDSRYLALGTWEGQVSLWEQSGECWKKRLDLETERGTMITTLAFSQDSERLVTSRLQSPARTQIWNTRNGADQGGDFRTGARAVLDTGSELILIRERDVASLSISPDTIIERLCQVATNAIKAGLTAYSSEHVCFK